jgi:hypothetical protein
MAIDTFTKWMGVEPVINITHESVVKFLKRIIFRFGMPWWVIIDNIT